MTQNEFIASPYVGNRTPQPSNTQNTLNAFTQSSNLFTENSTQEQDNNSEISTSQGFKDSKYKTITKELDELGFKVQIEFTSIFKQ